MVETITNPEPHCDGVQIGPASPGDPELHGQSPIRNFTIGLKANTLIPLVTIPIVEDGADRHRG